jgi:hypothetical protein
MANKKRVWKSLARLFLPGRDQSWGVVISCILLATTFWFFNALNKPNYISRIQYPLQFTFNDSLYMAVKEPPDVLRLEVTGGGWDLLRRSLGYDMPPLEISLENPENNRFLLADNLVPQITERLGELKVNYAIDDTLFLQIEAIISRKLKLELDTFNLDIAENIELNYPIIFSPDSVEVRGPKSFIEALPPSLFVDLEGENLEGAYEGEIAIGTLGSDLYTLSPQKATISIAVTEFAEFNQDIKLIAINAGNNPSMEPVQESIQVKYLAPVDKFPSALVFPWEVVLDFNAMDPSDSTIAPFLRLGPDFIRQPEIVPERVKMKPLNER